VGKREEVKEVKKKKGWEMEAQESVREKKKGQKKRGGRGEMMGDLPARHDLGMATMESLAILLFQTQEKARKPGRAARVLGLETA
jgi:hypothetical protein